MNNNDDDNNGSFRLHTGSLPVRLNPKHHLNLLTSTKRQFNAMVGGLTTVKKVI